MFSGSVSESLGTSESYDGVGLELVSGSNRFLSVTGRFLNNALNDKSKKHRTQLTTGNTHAHGGTMSFAEPKEVGGRNEQQVCQHIGDLVGPTTTTRVFVVVDEPTTLCARGTEFLADNL